MISGWNTTLLATFSAAGFQGDELSNLCDVIGGASESSVIGAPFTTTDSGPTSGGGTGAGTGVSVNQQAIADALYARLVAVFGQAGSELDTFCDIMASTCAAMMNSATLTSAHSPVFAGSGNISSISVSAPAWQAAIESASPYTGENWPDIAQAIAEEYAAQITIGTGTVAITGSGSPGSAGTGTGTGSIS